MNSSSEKIKSLTDLNYINKRDFNSIADQAIIAYKLLCALIKKSKDISTHNSQFTIHNSNNKNGFTLIEMLIAVSILAIMAVAISVFFVSLYKEQGSDVAKIKRIDVAGRTIESMSNNIRKMNRAENGIFPLEVAQEQALVFYADIDKDGLTERIEYSLNGTLLEKKIIESGVGLDYSGAETTAVIVEGVRNGTEPLFKYYDENYTGGEFEISLSEPVNVTNVKIIEIILDLNADEKHLASPFRAETKIHPRNLRNFD
ncbi:MAG: prepilin-type N-terminal cleavage/methylation domain-containing protein [Patescibacteria group bacterium]|nr:prepilin-type N-terminal cleavage/methylation domain-containing protein [Patescibacteria group bacterium]